MAEFLKEIPENLGDGLETKPLTGVGDSVRAIIGDVPPEASENLEDIANRALEIGTQLDEQQESLTLLIQSYNVLLQIVDNQRQTIAKLGAEVSNRATEAQTGEKAKEAEAEAEAEKSLEAALEAAAKGED